MRVPLTKTAMRRVSVSFGQVFQPAAGARLHVYNRGTTDHAAAYNSEIGGEALAWPLVANADGKYPNVWFGPGSYDLYSPDDISNPVEPWEAALFGDFDSAAVHGPSVGAIDDNIPAFDGVTGKLIKDGGMPIAKVLRNDQSSIAQKTDSTTITSPAYEPVYSWTFTPTDTESIQFVPVGASFFESGGAWGGIEMLYGDASLAPLTSGKQGILSPGVTAVYIGAVAGNADTAHRPVKLTGLTPGTPVTCEVYAAVVGGYQFQALPETPLSVAASFSTLPSVTGAELGDTIVAFRGANKLMIMLYNAWNRGILTVRYLGEVALPPGSTGSVTVAPNGRYVAATNTEASTVTVVDINTMVEIAGSPFATPDAAAAPKGIYALTNAGAYICGSASDKLYVVALATGVMSSIALGAATAPTKVRGGGTKVLVSCPGTGEVLQINATLGTVTHRYAVANVIAAEAAPFGGKAYAVAAPGGNSAKVYEIDMNALTIDAGVVPDTINGFTPTNIRIFSDGLTALVVGNDSANFHQIAHMNLPDRDIYTEWANDNGLGPGRVTVASVDLHVYGAIFLTYTGGVNIFPGGAFNCRHTFEAFEGEYVGPLSLGAA